VCTRPSSTRNRGCTLSSWSTLVGRAARKTEHALTGTQMFPTLRTRGTRPSCTGSSRFPPSPDFQALMCARPNISLSATTTTSELFTGPSHCKYIPPHPQKGTKYHRYTLLLLPHADPAAPIEVPKLDAEQRAHFDVRAFAAHYGLDGAKGGGAHMWREVWDEEVSNIYMGRLRECFRLCGVKRFLIHCRQTPRSRCMRTRASRTRTRSSGSRSGTWLDLALCKHYVMHALVNHNAFALGFIVGVSRAMQVIFARGQGTCATVTSRSRRPAGTGTSTRPATSGT
jgi:hypothetical protein